ncbi:MAG TPA: VOC family protein [Acidimicrobiales bacterium]|nr:VOC family protein [Acidimicrobiales bacterium]
MGEGDPDLHMLNLVVQDMEESLTFYRLLGVAVPEADDVVGGHAQVRMPSGFSLEIDTASSTRLWHAAMRSDPAPVNVVVGFSLPTREAVDERYEKMTDAGYTGRQRPFDAFWGARYAIVSDPDGNDVGLMSPMDESRRVWPPQESPG